MKLIRKVLIASGLIFGTGLVAYELLLTDEAKQNVHMASQSVRSAYDGLRDTIQEITGIVMDEEFEERQTREKTESQWESLGY